MKGGKIHIVVIEDELMVSGVLQAWIARFRDLELVGSAVDGEAGLKLCETKHPDVALVDIQLPKIDGLELVRRLTNQFPDMRLLLMSGLTDPCTALRVMQSGVHGFVSKTQSPELLIEAIRNVSRGNTFFGATITQIKQEWLSLPDAFHKVLSEREQLILRSVAAGWEDEQIGTELAISPATVETHRKRIRQKLGVHNDRGLIAYARRWGLDIRTLETPELAAKEVK